MTPAGRWIATLVVWCAGSSCGAASRVPEPDVEADLRATASEALQCDAIERIESVRAARFVDDVCAERAPVADPTALDVVATLSEEGSAPCTRWEREDVDVGHDIDAWRVSGCARTTTLVCWRGCDGTAPLECLSPDLLQRVNCDFFEYRRG